MSAPVTSDFTPFEERMRQAGLSQIVIDNFRHYYHVLATGSLGLISEAEIAPVTHVPDITETLEYHEAGQRILAHTAILKLNGGLGTSMGLDKAKSLLTVRDGLTFLDIIAHQAISFNTRYHCTVPLILMNSFNTNADSQAALAHYPALNNLIPNAILQNKTPKIHQNTLGPVDWPADPQLEWNPPGHGEVYIVLATSGMLDLLLEHGYQYLFMSNSDNLGATLDLGLLGYIASKHIPFLMEVADRSEADKKGGHIAQLQDGQLILREVAQCPETDLTAFQDITKHKYFNTNNIWIDLIQLKQVLAQNNNVIKLPMIRNAKTIDPKDSNSLAIYQLETAMGAAINVFNGAQVIRVTRERFMPVKTCDDLLRLRSDSYQLDEHYQLHPTTSTTTRIRLDPRFYKRISDFEARFAAGVPSLKQCTSLTVQGDVLFGAGITCQGAVSIINPSSQQQRLPEYTVLTNTEYQL